MSITVPLYGFGGSGGGAGGKLIVTAPAGATVTVSKDGKTKTKVASAEGVAVFQGLTTGEWTVTITDGTQTATKTVTITTDYAVAITFFSATINVTYPAGSTCTATDGVTTLTAPDTSGEWACVVPNAGTWTVTSTDGTDTDSEDVSIAEDGQNTSVELSYWNGELYYAGNQYADITGGWVKRGTSNGSLLTIGDVTFDDSSIILSTKSVADGTGKYNIVFCTTENLIDVTDFDTLEINVSVRTSAGSIALFNKDSEWGSGHTSAAKLTISSLSAGRYSLDISSIAGEYYVGVMSYSELGASGKITVTEVLLS